MDPIANATGTGSPELGCYYLETSLFLSEHEASQYDLLPQDAWDYYQQDEQSWVRCWLYRTFSVVNCTHSIRHPRISPQSSNIIPRKHRLNSYMVSIYALHMSQQHLLKNPQ